MDDSIDDTPPSGIDQSSEIRMVNAVNRLNLLIDEMILGIVAADHSNEREVEVVVKFYLRNLVIISLHTHFFDGQHFFGVGNDLYHTRLERMMTELSLIYGGELFFFF